jgi:septation ring formation regulator EzrA
MEIMQPIKFDVLEFLKEAKRLNISEDISNFSVEEINKIIEIANKQIEEVLQINAKEIEKSIALVKDCTLQDFKHLATKIDVNSLKSDINSVQAEFKIEVSKLKFELLRWMIGLSITMTTTIIGVLIKYLP